MGIVVEIDASSNGVITYYIDGVLQPTAGAAHFTISDNEYIHFHSDEYDEAYWAQSISSNENADCEFTAPEITIDGLYSSRRSIFNGDTTIFGANMNNRQNSFNSNYLRVNGNLTIQTAITNSAIIIINNGYLNTDAATWTSYTGDFQFTGDSSLKITTDSNGKTLIKGGTVSGTITLDVDEGVQDGSTFSIEATDNQIVITDGEWTATPSTVGNVTTYTLAKAGPSKKFRLFYTVDGGNRTLRLLGGIL